MKKKIIIILSAILLCIILGSCSKNGKKLAPKSKSTPKDISFDFYLDDPNSLYDPLKETISLNTSMEASEVFAKIIELNGDTLSIAVSSNYEIKYNAEVNVLEKVQNEYDETDNKLINYSTNSYTKTNSTLYSLENTEKAVKTSTIEKIKGDSIAYKKTTNKESYLKDSQTSKDNSCSYYYKDSSSSSTLYNKGLYYDCTDFGSDDVYKNIYGNKISNQNLKNSIESHLIEESSILQYKIILPQQIDYSLMDMKAILKLYYSYIQCGFSFTENYIILRIVNQLGPQSETFLKEALNTKNYDVAKNMLEEYAKDNLIEYSVYINYKDIQTKENGTSYFTIEYAYIHSISSIKEEYAYGGAKDPNKQSPYPYPEIKGKKFEKIQSTETKLEFIIKNITEGEQEKFMSSFGTFANSIQKDIQKTGFDLNAF